MGVTVVKSPHRLHRAKIYRSEDIIIKESSSKLSMVDISSEALDKLVEERLHDLLISDIREIEERERLETERIEKEKKNPTIPVFSENFTITNYDIPLKISFIKVDKENNRTEKIDAEIQQSYKKGFQEGKQSTINSFKSELEIHQNWVLNFDDVVNQFIKQYKDNIRNFEESLSYLSVLVAEHILNREVSTDSSIVIEQVKKAFRSLDDEIIFKIQLNPSDVEILEEVKSSLLSDSTANLEKQNFEDVLISGHSTIGIGGCVLETSVGLVDARLKTQLSKIEQILEEKIKNSLNQPDNEKEEKK